MATEAIYYILERQLPGLDPGEVFTIGQDLGGSPIIFCGDFKLPVEYAMKFPDWFIPVTTEEHRKAVKESFWEYGKETGHTEEQIKTAWQNFNN